MKRINSIGPHKITPEVLQVCSLDFRCFLFNGIGMDLREIFDSEENLTRAETYEIDLVI